MESYNILHARNELAHNNRIMLQASGIFCVWIISPKNSDLDEFLTLSKSIAVENNIVIHTQELEQAIPEEVHQYLTQTYLDEVNVLFLIFCPPDEFHNMDDFIGQEATAILHDQIIKISKSQIAFDLSKDEDVKQWEVWLKGNMTSHQIEYYDPEIG